MRSLRARLLALLSATVLAVWLATAAFSYLDARREIGAMLDAHLAQTAGLLIAQMEHELDEMGGGYVTGERRRDQKIAYQVWDARGLLRLRSDSAPETRLSPVDAGYADAMIEGKRWRIYSRWSEDRELLVQVGERYELRAELAESVAGHLVHPLAVVLPVLALLIWISVGRGLAPLGALAREVEQRAPDNLAPFDPARAPREVLPLTRALNALFERLGRSLEMERRFTADAAHELRTPLAAVKTQAQVALGARNAEERERALGQVVSGVDRTAHLVEQLLVLARLDPGAAVIQRETVVLDDLAARGLVELAAAAAAKDIDIGLEGDEDVRVCGDATLLGILLRNLVDNAIRYTPAGGSVVVRAERRRDGAALVVSDTGPGIPAAQRARVRERFYRVLGSGEEGSGLGLSIVQRIADLHGARLTLGDGPGGSGLSAEVAFFAVQP